MFRPFKLFKLSWLVISSFLSLRPAVEKRWSFFESREIRGVKKQDTTFLPIFALPRKKRGSFFGKKLIFKTYVFENVDNSTSKRLVQKYNACTFALPLKKWVRLTARKIFESRETIALCSDANRNGTKGKSSEYNFDLTR